METPDYSGVGDTHVSHEAEAAAATDAQMRRTSTHAAIADVTATAISDAASPGATYAQAEVVALRTELVAVNARLAATVAALNGVLAVLRDAELIPSS
jgi:hypothetical protein